jgi:hypothetical protein
MAKKKITFELDVPDNATEADIKEWFWYLFNVLPYQSKENPLMDIEVKRPLNIEIESSNS